MDRILVDFIKALRGNGVRIATSETLDAIHAVELVGYRDRNQLRQALAVTLAKSEEEKQRFDACFEQFFQFSSLDKLDTNPETPLSPDQRQHNMVAPSQAEPAPAQSPLGQMLLQGDRQAIAQAMAEAAGTAQVRDIRIITQRGLYGRRMMMAMGLSELEQELWAAESSDEPQQQALGRSLRHAREQLREEVKHFVERQYLLHATGDSRALRESVMRETSLENLRQFKEVQTLVRKLAKKLAATHSRRRKVYQRGKLDVRNTIRHNIPHSGILLETHWKTKRIDKPRIMAICDVSGSVSQYSRFLLMFLYSLTDVIANVRAFAFSSDLQEVTQLFADQDLEPAIETTLRQVGGGSTDYGRSLETFSREFLQDVNHRTTVIILGDGRNNYGDPRSDRLHAIQQRAQQLIWLNPESRLRWDSGDSEMKRYRPYCSWAETCQSLAQLERFISNLLRYGQ